MIVEIKELPKGTRCTNGGQKGQIYRDIKEAMEKGITRFELVDDCYNYKYLAGYAKEVIDDMFRREYGRKLWESHRKKLEEYFKNDSRHSSFHLGSYEYGVIFDRFYAVKSVNDKELGRKRVFVELRFSEELAEKAMQELEESEKKKHIDFLKKYYPKEAKQYV